MKTKQILLYAGLAVLPCLLLIADGRTAVGLVLMILPLMFAATLIGERYLRLFVVNTSRAKARRRRADLRSR